MRNENKYRKIRYKAHWIWIGRKVRNHSDQTHSVIIVEGYPRYIQFVKRYSGLITEEDEEKAIKKAKTWIDEHMI